MGGEQTASVGQISRMEAHFRQRSKTLTKHMQMQLDVSSSLIFPRPCPVYWWDQRHSSCCKCSGFLAFFSLILSENSHLSAYITYSSPVAVVQSLSHVLLLMTPWTAARQTSLSFTISCSLLKLMSIELVMPSNHLVLCPLGHPDTLVSHKVYSFY